MSRSATSPDVVRDRPPLVAIACGGTGGHLFPGLAVADHLQARGVEVRLLISRKEVDQQAVRGWPPHQIITLPAVALESGRRFAFLRGFTLSLREVRRRFRQEPPRAVLSLGSYTSVPPVLAGRGLGAATLLHEANSIPGRANRWLAHVVHEALVYFPSAAEQLWHTHVRTVGMPIRPQFQPGDAAAARVALGLDPQRPVLLVTGGSQGARALNDAFVRTVPSLRLLEPHLQILHLTGPLDFESVRQRYAALGVPARVRPFLTEMDLALVAASAVLSRAGASCLAETAATRVPPLLIPLPSAADNHQFHNARHFTTSGAARMLPQAEATPEKLLWELRALLQEGPLRSGIQSALARWHTPRAAEEVADALLTAMGWSPTEPASAGATPCAGLASHRETKLTPGMPVADFPR